MVPDVPNRSLSSLFTIAIALGALTAGASFIFGEENEEKAVAAKPTAAIQRSPEQAKIEAAVLHDTLHDTLQIVHHTYYKEDEGLILPAETLREVFADIEKEHHVKFRWLVVEGQAMNSDHVAKDDFERAAVQALLTGHKKHEIIEDGYYRHAGPIALTNVCLKCHVPDRRSTETRTAGLIISIPVRK